MKKLIFVVMAACIIPLAYGRIWTGQGKNKFDRMVNLGKLVNEVTKGLATDPLYKDGVVSKLIEIEKAPGVKKESMQVVAKALEQLGFAVAFFAKLVAMFGDFTSLSKTEFDSIFVSRDSKKPMLELADEALRNLGYADVVRYRGE